jgi:hypothetical protein
MTESLSRRIRGVTTLSIIGVVVAHATTTETVLGGNRLAAPLGPLVLMQRFVSGSLASVAIRLLFAVSGFLFFYSLYPSVSGFARKLRRRNRSLVLPYLAWSAVWIFVICLMQTWPQSASFFSGQRRPVLEWSTWEFAWTWILDPIPGQFWFLRTLIVLVALTPAIWWVLQRLGGSVVVVLGAVAMLTESFIPAESIFYYVLGSYLAIRQPFDLEVNVAGRRLLLGFWLLVCMYKVYVVCYVQAGRESTVALHTVCGALGVLSIWLNYDLLRAALESAGLVWLSQFNFFVFAAHEPAQTVFERLGARLFGFNGATQLALYLTVPLLTIVICAFAAALLRRRAPPVYFALSGGR